MDAIFEQAPAANVWYQQSKKAFKRSKGFGIASLVSLGLGSLLTEVGDDPNRSSLTGTEIFGATLILISFPILGSIGLRNLFRGNATQKNAITLFNEYDIPRMDLGWQPKLLLGSTPNGVGLVFSF